MTDEAFSRSEVAAELEEMRKDYTAFSEAYTLIRERITECANMNRRPALHAWSGTNAVCGSLELSIHSIERTIEEYAKLLCKIDAGELRNSDQPERPRLTLVKEEP